MSLVLCTESEAGNGLEESLEALLERGNGEISIGRHPTNEIVFNSSRVPRLLNRFHAYIQKNANGFYCGDKNTANGTYVSFPSYVHLHSPLNAALFYVRLHESPVDLRWVRRVKRAGRQSNHSGKGGHTPKGRFHFVFRRARQRGCPHGHLWRSPA
eukprot:9500826-Pyramimonas_sp.AAC.2